VSYLLTINLAPTLQGEVIGFWWIPEATGADTSFIVPAGMLTGGRTYYWSVMSTDGTAGMNYSRVESFTTPVAVTPPPGDGSTPSDTPAGPATVTDYRASVAGDIAALPPVGDAAALAAAYATWHAKAASSPGATEPGQIQLGADPQEYRPSDAELVAAEAGDRLSAALQGAVEATRTSVTTIVGDARTYRRFDFRRVDVMGSGRYYYASQPREASLPL
ncbi:MAG: hypothetical protein ABMA14_24495, partial [Hyphomonadaceae bacterium]